ncbi:MAG: hypothetical protein QOJ16_3010 [Acidobacteriota bacterium]|nr:hypothetical protein [Acidobacteriota bacterium]
MSRRVLLFLSIFGLLTSTLEANEYKSPLGFVGDVPSGWEVFTSKFRETPALFNEIFSGLQKRDPHTAEALRDRVMSGRQDVIFRIERADVAFRDNINILSGPGRLPATDAEAHTVCKALKESLGSSEAQATLKACEARTVGSNFTLFLEQEGTIPGTTVLQYQVLCPPRAILGVTATIKAESLLQARKDLDQFIASIRCNL